MTWEYRVLKRKLGDTETFGIYEVYCNKKGKIKYISAEQIYVYGESLEELKEDFEFQRKAFDLPVLDYDEIIKSFKKEKKNVSKEK